MTDSERLDWMIEHEAMLDRFGEGLYRCEWWSQRYHQEKEWSRPTRLRSVTADSGRAAIDAAMREEG